MEAARWLHIDRGLPCDNATMKAPSFPVQHHLRCLEVQCARRAFERACVPPLPYQPSPSNRVVAICSSTGVRCTAFRRRIMKLLAVAEWSGGGRIIGGVFLHVLRQHKLPQWSAIPPSVGQFPHLDSRATAYVSNRSLFCRQWKVRRCVLSRALLLSLTNLATIENVSIWKVNCKTTD